MPVEFEVKVCALAVAPYRAAAQVSAETTPLPIVISFIINLRFPSQPIPPIKEEGCWKVFPVHCEQAFFPGAILLVIVM